MISIRLRNTHRAIAAAATIGLALGSSSAVAQVESAKQAGSHIYSKPKEKADEAAANRYSKAMARCVLTRLGNENVAVFLLASDPVSTNLEGTGLRWTRVENVLEDCLSARLPSYNSDVHLAQVGMRFSQNRLRALLMEEAYLDANDTPLTLPEEATELTNRTYVTAGDKLASARGLGMYADCVVYRNPAGADAILRTEPGSAGEMAAARALASVLGGCLVEGQTIEFTPSSIRAIAADGLWSRTTFGSEAG